VKVSFEHDTKRSKELKREISGRQFVMIIFEYFGYLQTIKMQILNRRFYLGILPNWMH
jgi:hypothetical protein